MNFGADFNNSFSNLLFFCFFSPQEQNFSGGLQTQDELGMENLTFFLKHTKRKACRNCMKTSPTFFSH